MSGGGTSFRKARNFARRSRPGRVRPGEDEAFGRSSFGDCQVFIVSGLDSAISNLAIGGFIALSDHRPCASFIRPVWVAGWQQGCSVAFWRRGEMAAEQMEEAASSHAHDIVTGRDANDGKGLYGSTPARKQQGQEIHSRPASVMPCVAIQPDLLQTRRKASLVRDVRHDTRHTGTVRPPAKVPCARVVCSTR
jgi:hypothetical protein